jgi:hypothetical protein
MWILASSLAGQLRLGDNNDEMNNGIVSLETVYLPSTASLSEIRLQRRK